MLIKLFIHHLICINLVGNSGVSLVLDHIIVVGLDRYVGGVHE